MDSSVPLPSTGSFEDNITSLNRAATVHGSPSRSHQRRPSLPMSPSLLSTSPLLIPTSSSHRRQGSFAQETGRDIGLGSMGGGGSPSASMFLGGLMGSPGAGGVHRAASARDRSPSKVHHRKSSSISQSQTGISVPTSSYLGSSPRSSTFNAPAAALGALGRRRSYLEPARPEIKLDTSSTGQRQRTQVLRQDDGKWLDVTGGEIVHGVKAKVGFKVVDEDLPMEQAVEALLADECTCLLVRKVDGDFAFFDFADLNTFLLLVLHATSTEKSRAPSRSLSISSARGHVRTTIDDIPSIDEHAVDDEELPSILDERSKSIVRRLRRNEKVSVGSICDISGKNPYTSYPANTCLRSLLPLFASGLHRIALTRADADPLVLADITIIEHLVSLKPAHQPPLFELAVTAPSAGFPLHPLISLPGTASVLDAMQVMSLNGLSGLGVLSGSGSGSSNSSRARRESSGSSGSSNSGYVSGGVGWNPVHRSVSSSALTASPAVSPAADLLPMPNPFEMHGGAYGSLSGMEAGQLMSVVTAEECTRVVVPSEGKQVLGMGLGEMVRKVQYVEAAGRERGEERVPVHTIPYNSTILHAAHLILATSSSRVFLRPTPLIGTSPPLSPTPSLSGSISSPPSSPSLSSLSLSESRGYISQPFCHTSSALPPPPPTQLSAHHVVSTLDILSCLARAYHGVLTPPPGVRAIMSQTRAPGQVRTSLLSQRIQAPAQGPLGEASPPGGATSGLPSGGSGRLSFKDADIAGARKEMEAGPPQGQSVRSKVPRSKLRGSIMMMPSEVGGVAGWELDTEQIKQGNGDGRRQSQESSARDTTKSARDGEGKKTQKREIEAGLEGGSNVDQHKEGGGGGGYGGWRWAARVNEDG